MILAKTLASKLSIQTIFDPGEQDKLFERTAAIAVLSRDIRRQGGYSNLVPGDSLYRLSLSRLCQSLVQHPGDYEKVDRLLLQIKQESVSAVDLGLVFDEELAVQGSVALLTKTKRGDRLPIVFRTADTSSLKAVFASGVDGPTSQMLQKRSLGSLVFRLAESDLVTEHALPGLIDFFKRGGKVTDLDPRDIRPFLSIMGEV